MCVSCAHASIQEAVLDSDSHADEFDLQIPTQSYD